MNDFPDLILELSARDNTAVYFGLWKDGTVSVTTHSSKALRGIYLRGIYKSCWNPDYRHYVNRMPLINHLVPIIDAAFAQLQEKQGSEI